MLGRVLLVLSVLVSFRVRLVNSHQESSERSCNPDPDIRLRASFRPGIITFDDHVDEWNGIDGFQFSLLPPLWTQFLTNYTMVGSLPLSENKKCPSVALMFQIKEDASYHKMGGCNEAPDNCTSKTCQGHEVDIMHFSIGNAIPRRLYGGNPIDNRAGNGGDR
ncbi:hypothetical protein HYC85_032326 [Camellia sinensis]|uniref:Uncharacterized protein n=1 Tax=Camellia sinensis TaxID=4442 RepID=A0A7J7FSU3_CAMSI|nr:hypothetical protein HYC85_032326 [Camellia sinensis]